MPTKRRILCVDDQDDMCSLIATILADHEVVSAHSKAEAIRKATSGLFDLYFLIIICRMEPAWKCVC
jgi:CheY-like chemotaxis protein